MCSLYMETPRPQWICVSRLPSYTLPAACLSGIIPQPSFLLSLPSPGVFFSGLPHSPLYRNIFLLKGIYFAASVFLSSYSRRCPFLHIRDLAVEEIPLSGEPVTGPDRSPSRPTVVIHCPPALVVRLDCWHSLCSLLHGAHLLFLKCTLFIDKQTNKQKAKAGGLKKFQGL